MTIVDVGARWGPDGAWRWLHRRGLADLVLVEPEPVEAADLRARFPGARVLECALGSATERQCLHVTAEPGRSSLLRPDPDATERLGLTDAYRVEHTVEIDVTRADELGLQRVDVVKLDVQGGELDVLVGFGSLLHDVVAVELEVPIQRTYLAQPTFDDVNAYLVAAGFVPVDVRPLAVGKTGIIDANASYQRRDITSRRAADVLTCWRLARALSTNGRLQRAL